jgi:hypothetical protein
MFDIVEQANMPLMTDASNLGSRTGHFVEARVERAGWDRTFGWETVRDRMSVPL